MASKSDYEIALMQFIKAKRTEVRLNYALMADAEVARAVPGWRLEFEKNSRNTPPQVHDFDSEAKRRAEETKELGDGS